MIPLDPPRPTRVGILERGRAQLHYPAPGIRDWVTARLRNDEYMHAECDRLRSRR